MNIVIIGNGILGLTTAFRLLRRDSTTRISLIGPKNRMGCASLAAAAMLNSFCEVEVGTLQNALEESKFKFNREAAPLWPAFLREIGELSSFEIPGGFGTFLINNHESDTLEDANFDAIVNALETFSEPFETISPSDIPNFKPNTRSRAARAILIPNEGWVNPIACMSALDRVLELSGRVRYIDAECSSIERTGELVSHISLDNGERIAGDAYLLAPGANFSNILKNSRLDIQTPRILYGIGCSLLLRTDELTLSNCIRTPNRGLACGVYSAPQDEKHTLIGATNLISTNPEYNPRANNVASLLKHAIEQINSEYYRSQLVKINIGWRPTSEDTLPLIGPTSLRNMWIATGTKRDGFHCSPLISRCLSDLILQGETATDLSLFAPERSPTRVYSRPKAVEAAVRHIINAAYQHGFAPPSARMVEDLQAHYTIELERLHDSVGAIDWGIPPEMVSVYKAGYLK